MNQIQEYQSQETQLATAKMELDSQVATAKQYPRDITQFVNNVEAVIVNNPELAAQCNYSLTKGGSIITGPSIRLAEVIMSSWGNLRTGAKVLGHDGKFVSVHAFAHDLESNNRIDVEVKRRITNKHGKTYNDDMIQVTAQAGISIGIRNALFKVIPTAFVNNFSEIAQKAAVGKKEQFADRIAKAFNHFMVNFGISEDRIMQKLGVTDKRKLNSEHLSLLLNLATGIRDGQTTIENEFPNPIKQPEPMTPEDDEPAAFMEDGKELTEAEKAEIEAEEKNGSN